MATKRALERKRKTRRDGIILIVILFTVMAAIAVFQLYALSKKEHINHTESVAH